MRQGISAANVVVLWSLLSCFAVIAWSWWRRFCKPWPHWEWRHTRQHFDVQHLPFARAKRYWQKAIL